MAFDTTRRAARRPRAGVLVVEETNALKKEKSSSNKGAYRRGRVARVTPGPSPRAPGLGAGTSARSRPVCRQLRGEGGTRPPGRPRAPTGPRLFLLGDPVAPGTEAPRRPRDQRGDDACSPTNGPASGTRRDSPGFGPTQAFTVGRAARGGARSCQDAEQESRGGQQARGPPMTSRTLRKSRRSAELSSDLGVGLREPPAPTRSWKCPRMLRVGPVPQGAQGTSRRVLWAQLRAPRRARCAGAGARLGAERGRRR